MKGIILSGGSGTRLRPLTKITSKQLLPVYSRPMIYYPLNTLIKAGVTEILIIVAPDHAGSYFDLLGSGKEFGCRFSFEVQSEPRGLAEAFIIGASFIGDDDVCMILGDNLYEDDFTEHILAFQSGAKVFAKQVADPERFGVVRFDSQMKAQEIVEKPQSWISDYAVTGLYVYDNRVVDIAKQVLPSQRGELEITDINNAYLALNELEVAIVTGDWLDAGTFDSLLSAQLLAKEKLDPKMII